MHTETNVIVPDNMQQQPTHHQQQQHYVNHLTQDHITEQHQQQFFTHLPSTTTGETATSLCEGLYGPTSTPTTQQHLTSECISQCYSGGTRFFYPPTCSSSSSSNSSSSSEDSNYFFSKSSTSQSCKNNTASIGVNLRVTGQCSQGGRKYMEDYFSVAYQQSENAKDLEYAFIGIYDGHGGAEAAKFAKEHLMMEIINQRLFWSDNDHHVLRAIREGYIATHYAMWREQAYMVYVVA